MNILGYYMNNVDDFNNDIEELDDYNGCLNGKRYIPMEDLDEYLIALTPTEIIDMVYYGGDDDGLIEFEPSRNYFYVNLNALWSTDDKDYSEHLDEYTINQLIENYKKGNIDLCENVKRLLSQQNVKA